MKRHPEFKKYYVTRDGRVFSTKRKGLYEMSQNFTHDGYLTAKINGEKRRVHRLVAQTYLPNPHNYPQVNHIDCDKSNNCVNNLEWCDGIMNIKHAKENGLTFEGGNNGGAARKYKLFFESGEELVIENLYQWCIAHKCHKSQLYNRGRSGSDIGFITSFIKLSK